MHQFLKFIVGKKTLHVSDSSSVYHQKFFTVHTAMVYIYIYMYIYSVYIYIHIKCKGKVIPLQARCGPEGG